MPRGFDALFTNLTRLVMELFSSYFRGKSGIYTITLSVPGVRSFSLARYQRERRRVARALKYSRTIIYPSLRTIHFVDFATKL